MLETVLTFAGIVSVVLLAAVAACCVQRSCREQTPECPTLQDFFDNIYLPQKGILQPATGKLKKEFCIAWQCRVDPEVCGLLADPLDFVTATETVDERNHRFPRRRYWIVPKTRADALPLRAIASHHEQAN